MGHMQAVEVITRQECMLLALGQRSKGSMWEQGVWGKGARGCQRWALPDDLEGTVSCPSVCWVDSLSDSTTSGTIEDWVVACSRDTQAATVRAHASMTPSGIKALSC
jgi:hypothetical protein